VSVSSGLWNPQQIPADRTAVEVTSGCVDQFVSTAARLSVRQTWFVASDAQDIVDHV